MIDFKEAYRFISTNSSYTIFQRTMPYQVYSEWKSKSIKYTMFTILLAALCGPFTTEAFEQAEIKELLDLTDYGNKTDWPNQTNQWAYKYCKNESEGLYLSKLAALIYEKQNDIVSYMQSEYDKNEPIQYYIPELGFLGFLNEHWPRV